MSLFLSQSIVNQTTHPDLADERTHAIPGIRDADPHTKIYLDTDRLSNEALLDLVTFCAGDPDANKTATAIASILRARAGDLSRPVPNFQAFEGMLLEYLRKDAIDGWVYVANHDGCFLPYLVTDIEYGGDKRVYGKQSARNEPEVILRIAAISPDSDRVEGGQQIETERIVFRPVDVVRKSVAKALEGKGVYKECPSTKESYLASMDHYQKAVVGQFAEQFRFTGKPHLKEVHHRYTTYEFLENRKVVMDYDGRCYVLDDRFHETPLLSAPHSDADEPSRTTGQIPVHPIVRVFDLKEHQFYLVNTDGLTPYEYDESLRDKLVLPDSHRELLDVLTTDIGAFVDDFIEGKSAGNVILCKGKPGVGKTLTAECYAEIKKRPLYTVHTGTLGTNASDIERNLQEVFERIKRWNCVGLLDEADIFVMARGNDIVQNSIVAVFLRTLEYFDGLLFMTSNRPDDIDEAILMRFAAIINYEAPQGEDARKVWKVMSEQFKADMSDELIAGLMDMLPEIAPRDVKMLLRRTMRLCVAKSVPLTLDAFRRSAMFQNVKIAASAAH